MSIIIRKIRRADWEVIRCAKLIAEGFTIMMVEEITGVPHSTISWTIRNRLPKLDYDLYEKCLLVYTQHIKREKKNDRPEDTTKSD